MSTRPRLVAFLLLVLVGLPAAGCGGGDDAAGELQQRTQRSELAETRATDSEARLQELREEVDRLKREQRRTTAAQAPAGGAGDPDRAAPGSAGDGTILSAQAREAFAQLEAAAGPVGVAVSPVGLGQPVEQLGSLQSGVAWSTSKVPVAMAAIAAGVADDGDLTAAITASDNAAATNLWNALGGGTQAAAAADAQLRAAGDDSTRIESRTLRSGFTPFGQTNWTLADQARFTAGMACTDAGGQVLGLMGDVIAAQRWGLAATDLPAEVKGGWGPGTQPGADGGSFDRQMGVLTIDGKPLAVTLASQPADGSHGTGTTTLTRLAQWVVEHADVSTLDTAARC